jgi:dolichol-phosphate mannosyltransferase
MAHVSVVVPVYMAEDCLEELYRRLSESLSRITEDWEIVLVEDCSPDRSWEGVKDLAQQDSRVKGLKFSRNFGQHYGITAGLDHCDGDWVVVMDCDLQDRPEEIPRLYDKAQEGYDVVLADRGVRKDAWYKRMVSAVFYRLFSYLADVDYDGKAGNFRIISRKVVLNFRQIREQLRFFGGLVHWMGFLTATLPVEHAERYEGKSSYNLKKLIKLAVETIIAYSDKPLRLTIKLGFFISLFSFSYGLWIIYRALFYGSTIVGWSSLIVSIYFIGGVIIAILGIIGIYIGKCFDEIKKRPLYIVEESIPPQ